MKKDNTKCLNCKKTFYVSPSKLKYRRGRFCSRRCSASFNHRGKPKPHSRKNLIIYNAKRRSGEIYQCPWNKQDPYHVYCDWCYQTFKISPSRFGHAKFCSRECSYRWKASIRGITHPLWKPKAQQICEWCQTPFETKPAKVLIGEGRFCSRNCIGAYVSAQQAGRRSSIEILVETVLILIKEPFEVQKPIGSWIVDFYLPAKNLVVECDGDYWHASPHVKKRDRQKDGWLKKQGYEVVRLREHDIKINVVELVQKFVLNFHGQLPLFLEKDQPSA